MGTIGRFAIETLPARGSGRRPTGEPVSRAVTTVIVERIASIFAP
jgi:hypothetical protein